jgi:hypothetical protein
MNLTLPGYIFPESHLPIEILDDEEEKWVNIILGKERGKK